MAIQSDWYSNISEWAFLKPIFYKLLQPRLRQNDFTMSHGVTMIPYDTKLLALGSRHPLFFWILKFLLNRCSHYAYQLPTFSPTLIIKSPITIFINTCTIIFTGFRQSSPFCPSKARSQPNGTYAGSGLSNPIWDLKVHLLSAHFYLAGSTDTRGLGLFSPRQLISVYH